MCSYYEIIGFEIWCDIDGEIMYFVVGVGMGGMIMGIGCFLCEVFDECVCIVGVDLEGSVYSGGMGCFYFVEGVGEDIWFGVYDFIVLYEIVVVGDVELFVMMCWFVCEEGIFVGGLSGMVVVGVLCVVCELFVEVVMVVLFLDGGCGYFGKIFNDGWMWFYGFSDVEDGEIVVDVFVVRVIC